jgi:hypothetical protein
MTEPNETVLIVSLVLFGIVIFAAIIYFSTRVSKRDTDRMQAFIQHLGLALPSIAEIRHARFADIEISYRYTQLGNGKKPELSVWYDHVNLGLIKVRRESGLDRVFKIVGLVAEVQTQDPTFDNAFFIDSAEPKFAAALLSRQSMREALEQIMRCGFDSITLSEDKILVQVTNPRLDHPEFGHINDVIQGLRALSIDQPVIAAHLGRDVRASWKIKIWTMYIGLGLIVTVGTALVLSGSTFFRPLDDVLMLKHSLSYASLAFLVSIVVLVAYLRGRSSSHVHLLVGGLIALIGWPLFSCGALMVANGFNDDNVDAHHRGMIEKKWSRTNKGNTTYKVQVRSWRAGRQYEDLVVPRTLYNQATVGADALVVTTRIGNYGYEWVSAPLVLGPISAESADQR